MLHSNIAALDLNELKKLFPNLFLMHFPAFSRFLSIVPNFCCVLPTY